MSDIYSSVYEALDATVTGNVCLASSEARIQRALTQCRQSGANRATTEQLERISVMLHELSMATFRRNQAHRQDLLERLRAASIHWANRKPIH
jgi:hypothetical protein